MHAAAGSQATAKPGRAATRCFTATKISASPRRTSRRAPLSEPSIALRKSFDAADRLLVHLEDHVAAADAGLVGRARRARPRSRRTPFVALEAELLGELAASGPARRGRSDGRRSAALGVAEAFSASGVELAELDVERLRACRRGSPRSSTFLPTRRRATMRGSSSIFSIGLPSNSTITSPLFDAGRVAPGRPRITFETSAPFVSSRPSAPRRSPASRSAGSPRRASRASRAARAELREDRPSPC